MRDLCRKFQISSVEHITALVALVSSRPDGPDSRIHQAPPRRDEDRIRASAARTDCQGNLRHFDLPGAGDAGGADCWPATRSAARICCGARWARRRSRKCRSSARSSSRAARRRTTFPNAKANQIFDLLEKFAGYGFNKSHAAAYAIVAYQTAYLKANYPVEFFCAMMTNDMADTAKLERIHRRGARRSASKCSAPDVNESQVYFAPAERAEPGNRPSASASPPSKASAKWRWKRF